MQPSDIRGSNSKLIENVNSVRKQKKQEILAKLLKEKYKGENIKIIKSDRESEVPLSFNQLQLWFLSQFGTQANVAYHMPNVLRLRGDLDRSALYLALSTLLNRHEILRTNFRVNQRGEPYQYINSESKFKFDVFNLPEECPSASKIDERKKIIKEFIDRQFDLSEDSLIRIGLIEHTNNEHTLLLVFHHIVVDAWSMGVFTSELSILYNAYCNGKENPLGELPLQYADYALWQRNWVASEAAIKELTYWREKLQGTPLLNLPIDRQRPAMQSFRGAWIELELDIELSQNLKSIGRRNGCTLFMTLFAVFGIFLHRYTQQTDICIGTPVANRLNSEVEPLVGFFVNMLALRLEIDSCRSFEALLKHVKSITLEAYQNQTTPFERVVNAVKPERSQAYSPLFQAMMTLQNVKGSEVDFSGLTIEFEKVNHSTSQFDISLELQEMPNGSLVGGFEYSTDLFDHSTLIRFKQNFIHIIKVVSGSPNRILHELDFLTSHETKLLLNDWNATCSAYSLDRCIHELFEDQAVREPNKLAVVFGETRITYADLNSRANQLAHYLMSERGVKPDKLVGICIERSLEMVISILGVLKAGGAYVPLDPSYPPARLAHMIADASLEIILTQSHLKEKHRISDVQAVCLDIDNIQRKLEGYRIENLIPQEIGLNSRNLAYVIFTSGSTGTPKGVMIEHRNTNALCKWTAETYSDSERELVLASTSICFDLSVFEILNTLQLGGSVCLCNNIFDLIDNKHEHKVTLINTVPSAISALQNMDAIPRQIKVINLAGEPLKQSIVDSLYEKSVPKVFDLYGPTEDTTYSTYTLRQPKGIATIGRPILNTQVYILDKYAQPCYLGVAGELYIGGKGLSRGYLNRDDLTSEKFIVNPYHDKSNPASSEKLYKTGDLCRYLADGNIEFLGRIDDQIKIRGFRIELREIEKVITSLEVVEDAVVLTKGDLMDKQINAYVVYKNGIFQQDIDLKILLAELLPDYMIPSNLVILDKLPLTANGKIDRRALASIDVKSPSLESYVPPTSAIEIELTNIWSIVFGLSKNNIGVNESLFNLGANSILTIILQRRISEAFDVQLRAGFSFEAKTIRDQAEKIKLMLRQRPTTPLDTDADVLYASEAVKHSIRRSIILSYKNGSCFTHDIDINREHDSSSAEELPRFFIACIDKVLITYLVLALHEHGLLDIHQSISEIYPNFYDKVNRKVTLATLLSHSSGLDWSNFDCVKSEFEEDDFLRENYYINQYPQIATPGKVFSYSHLGILISINIIENIVQIDYFSALKKYVFVPLGIDFSDSYVSYPGHIPDQETGEIKILQNDQIKKTSGGFLQFELSAMDLLKLAIVPIKNGFSLSNKKFISASLAKLLVSPQIFVSDNYYYDGWALGWFKYPETEKYGYISGAHGHHNCVVIDPKRKSIVIVQNDMYPSMDFFDFILKKELGYSLHRHTGLMPEFELKSITGFYKCEGMETMITQKDEKYIIKSRYRESGERWAKCIEGEIGYSAFGNYVVQPRQYPHANLIMACDENGYGEVSHIVINDRLLRKDPHGSAF